MALKSYSTQGCIFKDVHFSGDMTPQQVQDMISQKNYASWLYLAEQNNQNNPEKQVQESGLTYKNIPVIPKEGLPVELAQQIYQSMDKLPKPIMVQCTTSYRSSAAAMMYHAYINNLDGQQTLSLAHSLDMPFLKMEKITQWLGKSIPGPILFRQLFDRESCTYTYILADPDTKEAVLIDPVDTLTERDLGQIKELDLNLLYAINTHCHADHITGTYKIKEQLPNVKSLISQQSKCRSDVHVEPNESINFGKQSLQSIWTPGHTSGCMSYYTRANKGMVFSGDALLIRGCGRTDFQGGNPAQLFDSVRNNLFSLPEETRVYPAHDYQGRTNSTIKEEKTFNPRLKLQNSQEQFIDIMADLGKKMPYPKKIDEAVPRNMNCGYV